MDFEYEDDVEQTAIDFYANVIKRHPFEDDQIREVFRILSKSDAPVVPHDMFAYTFRESDIVDTRITRVCKSGTNHIFRIQFLNGDQFVIRLSELHSYEEEIAIINAAAGVGVEVPRNYFSHPVGIEIGTNNYYAMLQEHISGRDFEYAAKHGLITSSEKEVLLEAMGDRLKKIHSIRRIDGKVQQNMNENFFSDAMTLLDSERNNLIDSGLAVQEEFEDVYAKLDSLRDTAAIFGNYAFGLTHFSFHPKHVILDTQTGRPSIRAIIDWGDAAFSNTYFDFALWDYWCGEDFLVDSVMESYGMEAFSSAESKVNVELTTIVALINTLCHYGQIPDFKASQLGVWQRLRHEVHAATY